MGSLDSCLESVNQSLEKSRLFCWEMLSVLFTSHPTRRAASRMDIGQALLPIVIARAASSGVSVIVFAVFVVAPHDTCATDHMGQPVFERVSGWRNGLRQAPHDELPESIRGQDDASADDHHGWHVGGRDKTVACCPLIRWPDSVIFRACQRVCRFHGASSTSRGHQVFRRFSVGELAATSPAAASTSVPRM